MQRPITLEICAYSFEASLIAQQSGANRIELCSNKAEGGTTPPYSLIEKSCRELKIPIIPIIRPRGGNFLYSNDEFELMQEDIITAKHLGCKGVSFSILNKDNTIDKDRTAYLIQLASPMQVTFVRGFDLTPNPQQALKDLIAVKCHRILTSGQKNKAIENLNLLRELVSIAGNKISIMPGSGINAQNLEQLIVGTGATEFHASASILVEDESSKKFGFGSIVSCNGSMISQMRSIADQISVINY